MSLLVWLPLTGNINNHGLAASLTTTNTPVYKTTGKIGSCLDLNTRVQFSCPDLSNLQTFSIAFWAKVNADSSLTTNWVDVIGFTDVHTNGTSGQLRWETCYGSGYENRGISGHDNATYATTNGPNGSATAGGKGVWNHIVCTVENGVEVKEYRDGVLTGTYSSNGGHLNGTFWLGETGKVNGEINDVRIYDECLDPLEVKRLSQGLVAHYPLNDPYLEPTTNICDATNCGAGTGSWGAHSSVQEVYQTTDNDSVPFMIGNKFIITYNSTTSSGGGFGVRISNSVAASPNTTYTYSCYIKASDNLSYTHANFIYRYEYTDTSSSTRVTEGGLFSTSRMVSVGNGWYRCWGSFTTKDTTNAIRIYFYTYPGKNITYWVGGWQMEQKDHVTPYTPPLTTRNEAVVYDTSGYNHNGTSTGDFSVSFNSPRYAASTYFEDYTRYISCPFVFSPTEVTMSCWINTTVKSTAQGGYHIMMNNNTNTSYELSIYGSSGQLRAGYNIIRDGNATRYVENVGPDICDGKWHMVSSTYDGKNIKRYVDGQLVSTTAVEGDLWIFASLYMGSFASTAYGNTKLYQSDVRIYATALSADDVKALYEDSAYIATDGTAYAYEFVEE